MFDTAEMAIPTKTPGVDFQEVLEKIRTRIKSRGEIPQVRNLITDTSIGLLNVEAASLYDDNKRVVRFYGGMIHLHPQAYFTIKKPGKKTKDRDTNRELGDFLVVAVFSELDGSGDHVIKRKRSCLIQAKTSDVKGGATMFDFDPAVVNTPVGTDPEQFYLLNRLPTFTLVKDGSESYSLRTFNNKTLRPLAKYCYIWNGSDGKAPDPWESSWQCAKPVTSAKADYALGRLLADLIDGSPNVGVDFFPEASSAPNDWERLMAYLTEHCSTHEWGKVKKLADPAGVSFMSRVTAYATLQQHARAIDDLPYVHYFGGERPKSSWPAGLTPDGMPVLIISVASFEKDKGVEPVTSEARRIAISKAIDILRCA